MGTNDFLVYIGVNGGRMVSAARQLFDEMPQRDLSLHEELTVVPRVCKTEEDQMLEQQLLNDKKQCVEHIMLVDLERNYVGRISKPGTVKVEKLMNNEIYSHVMPLAPRLAENYLTILLPGMLYEPHCPQDSGAPKVKATELIDELEVTRRGPYSGGVGLISLNGNMDIALALQTIIFPTGTRYNTMY